MRRPRRTPSAGSRARLRRRRPLGAPLALVPLAPRRLALRVLAFGLLALPAQAQTLGVALRESGVLGWLAILTAFFLLVFGGLLIATRPPRRAFAWLFALALLPPAIGGLGLVFGSAAIERQVEAANERGTPLEQDELRQAYAQSRLPLKVGLVASAPIVALACLGLLFPRRPAASSPAP